MTECLIALGGNIGNVSDTFAAALERLATHPDIEISAVSRCFVTEPVGEDAGEAYLNAAAALSTSMEPARLLETTKEIEIALGRPADHATWAAAGLGVAPAVQLHQAGVGHLPPRRVHALLAEDRGDEDV